MYRIHAAKDDLDWLPQRYRLLRGAIVGGVWATIGGSVAAAMFWGAHLFLFGKGFVLVGTGGYWLGDRVSKGVVTRRLAHLASGRVDLARLSNADDGDLVHLRGVVRAQALVPSLFGHAPGVYRRVRASFGDYQAIEETAVDFQLVDRDGNAIGIEAEDARWLVQDGKLVPVLAPERMAAFEAFERARRFMTAWREKSRKGKKRFVDPRAAELMLRPGDEVEVVGYKSRQIDPTMTDRMFRETPMRATLRAGKDLPLILSRIGATV